MYSPPNAWPRVNPSAGLFSAGVVTPPTQIVTIIRRAPTAPKTPLMPPDVANVAPDVEAITGYDEQHRITYIWMLYATPRVPIARGLPNPVQYGPGLRA
jgi:hypothetical protein